MDKALFDWRPVRDARRARLFLGLQVLLAISWTVSGLLRHDSVFLWVGPVWVAVLLVAMVRPRFVVERDRIWWRGVIRTQSVPLNVVEGVRVERATAFAFRPVKVTTVAGEVLNVPGDSLGWAFDTECGRQRLIDALSQAADRHGYRLEDRQGG